MRKWRRRLTCLRPCRKPAGWLRQALSKKPKEMPVSQETTSSDAPPRCSDDPPSPDLNSTASAESPAALPPALESASCSSSGGGASCSSSGGGASCSSSGGGASCSSSGGGAASSSSDGGAASSSSSGRWSRDYDVCVCHSEEDLAAVQELVAYLEDSPASLRCFLQLRDSAPGGAIVSELCRALDNSHCRVLFITLDNSHCRVLFITPGFLSDPWCRYQMLQALSQAPGAEGRTIPLLVAGLARAAYPAELRFMYFVDGRGPDQGFRQVKEAILRYLQHLS
ncbi:toll/interleukin-1 receptor domain-containing adapter protein isoform X2 [Myotis lucifugus]|uniref:toll/interleukin-1 receptor domain-containing adapter protein isoform X2 n=1 Tax=Myotis lucifugus TaxID=59463 RepID=UPI000CCC41F4|nr:toll/interleukin-1 receptor domain-containing adapter protein isoform X2 [Myotis lucifugus]